MEFNDKAYNFRRINSERKQLIIIILMENSVQKFLEPYKSV